MKLWTIAWLGVFSWILLGVGVLVGTVISGTSWESIAYLLAGMIAGVFGGSLIPSMWEPLRFGRMRDEAYRPEPPRSGPELRIVFFPLVGNADPPAMVFVEVVDELGESVNAGNFRKRDDDLWELVIERRFDLRPAPPNGRPDQVRPEIFICSGACETGGCECRRFDALPLLGGAPAPPLHDGCHCYTAPDDGPSG